MSRTYWAGEMRPGEVALFHFEGKSRILCGADGESEAPRPAKFETLQDAEGYAAEYVQAHPARGCRLHDSEGHRIKDVFGAQCPVQRYTRAAAKRDLLIGLAGFVLMPFGFFLDKWIGWGIFLGMAIGTKFVMLGIIKLSEGIAGLMEPKPR